MRIQVTKGKIEDSLVVFGKDYNEIEEIEEFFTNCECSSIQLEVSSNLEQNQIQFYIVDRKKESKKPKKKPPQKSKEVNVNDILAKYQLNIPLEGELSDDNDQIPNQMNSNKYGEILNKILKLNVFYFNRQMFSMFSSLDEITSFILQKKVQDTKNLLVLEDIKDIFVSKQIRKAIQMTQTVPEKNYMSEEDDYDGDIFNMKGKKKSGKKQTCQSQQVQSSEDDQPQYQGNKFKGESNKRKSLQCNDIDIQDWLCEIGIKYDIDYRFTFSQKETNEYLSSCLITTVKSKYKKDLGMYDQKNKFSSELAEAEGLTGFYDQQWVQILMSINQISEKKAVAIAKQHRTITQLMNVYKGLDTIKQRELALQTVQYKGEKGKSEKSLGKCISKKVYNIFVNEEPNDFINL